MERRSRLDAAGSGKHAHLNGGNGLTATGGGYEPGWVTSDNSNVAPTDANLFCNATYQTWTSTPGSNEDLPINCVDWYEAYAFCIWDAGFLPSEAEWEYADVGGSQQQEYPWGSTAPGMTNQYAIYNCFYPGSDGGSSLCTGVGNVAPVGSAPLGAGLWGQLDLVGDMWEWDLAWFASSYVNPCSDCANFTPGASRVIRGSRFATTATELLPTFRQGLDPTTHGFGFGLRCARTP